jgi:hypothetical protein
VAPRTRRSPLWFVPWLIACGDLDRTPVCHANDGRGCDDCLTGTVTCSFEGVEVTEPSCEDCQARMALYDALCEAGSTATVSEVDDEAVCEGVVENRGP